MNNIEWKNGAVCYAGGCQWFDYQGDTLIDNIKTIDGAYTSLHCNVIKEQDFQLNEPRIGDYIPKSELDTERKYNDAVEAFGLSGFDEWAGSSGFGGLESYLYIDNDGEVINGGVHKKRPLTYSQLMAIGKLKRLMNERNNLKRRGEYSRCVQVDLGEVKTTEPCGDGFSVGYECNYSEKPNSCDKLKLATQYLNECIEVQKQRGEQYDSAGTGERSFAAAAKAYNSLTGQNLKGSDVCLLLTCVKAVRQYSNPNRLHEDSLLDGVSYLSLWAEELNKELK